MKRRRHFVFTTIAFLTALVAGLSNAQPSIESLMTRLSSAEMMGRKLGTEGELRAATFLRSQLLKLPGANFAYEHSEQGFHEFTVYTPKIDVTNVDFRTPDGSARIGVDFIPFVTSSSAFGEYRNILKVSCEDIANGTLPNLAHTVALIRESECNSLLLTKKWSPLKLIDRVREFGPTLIIMVAKSNKLVREATTWTPFLPDRKKDRWLAADRDLNVLTSGIRSEHFDDLKALGTPALYVSRSFFESNLEDLVGIQQTSSRPLWLSLAIQPIEKVGYNIVFKIPGTSGKDVLLTAHYDGQGMSPQGYHFPGADDNASGVAAALNVFKNAYLKSLTTPLKNGLIIALYSGEEWGLLGSRSFANLLKAKKLQDSIIANINFDAVSTKEAGKYYLLGAYANPDLVEYVEGFNTNLDLSKRIEFAFYKGSDHYSNHLLGIPSIDVTTSRTHEMDTINDTMDTVNISKVQEISGFFDRVLDDLLHHERGFQKSKKNYAFYPGQRIEEHHIDIEIEPTQNLAVVTDSFGYNQKPEVIKLTNQAESIRLDINGQSVPFQVESGSDVDSIKPSYPAIDGVVTIRYKIQSSPWDEERRHDRMGTEENIIIAKEGVYLSPGGAWYPDLGMDKDRAVINVSLPVGWSSITGGDLLREVTEGRQKETWAVEYDSEKLHLIAGKFTKTREMYKGISIETYFHEDLGPHSSLYIGKLKEYVDLYLGMFGYYPFGKFTVISNFFSTGYGMASYTLLDRNIVPYLFIVNTSLGHELLHNYWGNSIYVNYDGGNWCEGLTVYQADYLYKNLSSPAEGRQYRLTTLRQYNNLVNDENAFPMNKFMSRYSPASRAIGYGKVMMFYHMLAKKVGDDAFLQGLNSFAEEMSWEYASYDDLKRHFSLASGQNLEVYFSQWLPRKDILDVELELVGDSLRVTQKTNEPYTSDIEVLLYDTYGNQVVREFHIDSKSHVFHLGTEFQSAILDPDFHLMRTLLPSENPMTLNMFIGSGDREVASFSAEADDETLMTIASSLPGQPENVAVIRGAEWQLSSSRATLLFAHPSDLGNDVLKGILDSEERISISGSNLTIDNEGESQTYDMMTTLVMLTLKVGDAKLALVVYPEGQSPMILARKLSHYGKYSALVFDLEGKKQYSATWDVRY